MEETIQFIYEFIREYGVNIEQTLPQKPLNARLMKASPVVKNNFEDAVYQLIDRGILRNENGRLYLTEQGFNEVYNQ